MTQTTATPPVHKLVAAATRNGFAWRGLREGGGAGASWANRASSYFSARAMEIELMAANFEDYFDVARGGYFFLPLIVDSYAMAEFRPPLNLLSAHMVRVGCYVDG